MLCWGMARPRHKVPETTLDAIDLRILKVLQEDASLTNVDLAAKVGLSPSPCLARVRELKESGVILARVALLDPLQIGGLISVFIQVTLDKQTEPALERFEQAMRRFPRGDGMLFDDRRGGLSAARRRAGHRGVAEFHRRPAVEDGGVANIRSSFALKQVKYKTALPLDELLGRA